jgi:mRNA-degrading endonuclease RelE of RelBE toxin-antitoxin system
MRIGDLRIVYSLEGAVVVVLKVARRSESTYRRIDR